MKHVSLEAREPRVNVFATARIRSGDDWMDAWIHNASRSGLLIRSAVQAFPGQIIDLRKGILHIVARVIWCRGDRIGLEAFHKVDVIALRRLERTGGRAVDMLV